MQSKPGDIFRKKYGQNPLGKSIQDINQIVFGEREPDANTAGLHSTMDINDRIDKALQK